MELKDFLLLVVKNHTMIKDEIRGWSWYEYGNLADLTEHIDYHCEFGKSGSCRGYKTNHNSSVCCCSGCLRSIGYHKELPNDYYKLKAYASMFVPMREESADKPPKALGFWRAGKGCALPRNMRSPICLSYSCRSEAERTPWSTALIKILNRKEGNMKVYGKQCSYGWQVHRQLAKWLEDGQDKPEKHSKRNK